MWRRNETPTGELYIRWLQLGIFMHTLPGDQARALDNTAITTHASVIQLRYRFAAIWHTAAAAPNLVPRLSSPPHLPGWRYRKLTDGLAEIWWAIIYWVCPDRKPSRRPLVVLAGFFLVLFLDRCCSYGRQVCWGRWITHSLLHCGRVRDYAVLPVQQCVWAGKIIIANTYTYIFIRNGFIRYALRRPVVISSRLYFAWANIYTRLSGCTLAP